MNEEEVSDVRLTDVIEPSEWARGIAARCWCDQETEHLAMIPELAEAFAKRVEVLFMSSGMCGDAASAGGPGGGETGVPRPLSPVEALRKAINCECLENGSDTPDFILAEFLYSVLMNFDKAVKDRDSWYGRR